MIAKKTHSLSTFELKSFFYYSRINDESSRYGDVVEMKMLIIKPLN